MSKIKNFLATAAIGAVSTVLLTVAVSAATAEPASTNDHSLVGKYWRITEESSNITKFGNAYDYSQYADFEVQNGNEAILTGKGAYPKNAKFVMVTLRSNGDSTRKSKSGTSKTLSSGEASSPSGTIISATYNGDVYDSTSTDGGTILQGYIVNVTKT